MLIMKMLMITHLVPYPPNGGVKIRNYNLLREASRHHDIHLLTFYQGAHIKNQRELEHSVDAIKAFCKHLEVYEIPSDKSRFAWYSLLFRNLFSLTPYSVWRFHSPQMVRSVEKALSNGTFDLLEVGTIALADYTKLAEKVPKILVHHNIESKLLFRRSKYTGNLLPKLYLKWQAGKLRRYEHQMSTRFACHTVCSENDADTLKQICSDANITVVPNGVDTNYFRPSSSPIKPKTMVFVGGMGWFPNLDAMVFFKREIWPLIKKAVPEVNVKIIGNHPPKELVEYSRKDKSFQPLGFVEDIRPIVADAAVYIVPMRVGGGTRLKVLDAMAMGKAIVSTSIGCEGIDVRDGHDILMADTPAEFAQCVLGLFNDPQQGRRLGQSARDTATKLYSWKVVYQKLEESYNRALAMGR